MTCLPPAGFTTANAGRFKHVPLFELVIVCSWTRDYLLHTYIECALFFSIHRFFLLFCFVSWSCPRLFTRARHDFTSLAYDHQTSFGVFPHSRCSATAGTWAKSHRLVIKRVLKQLNQRLRKFQMAVLHLPESCSPIEPTMSYPSSIVG